MVWMLDNVPHLKNFTYALQKNEQKQLIQKVLDTWAKEVTPNLHLLQKGVDCAQFF